MLSFTGSLRVFVALEPCDMRKGFDGLSGMVASKLNEDLQSGALFVFSNRSHTRLKIIYWDGSGVWLMAKRLENLGAAAIMPLAAPIGSGLGVQNPVNLRMIIEEAKVPVIVDAGVGTASDAAVAMELGCDAVLMNTAIAEAKNPVLMAEAMKHAVQAGRLAYLAGRMPKKRYADPSSPLAGLI